jgi:hypothetical protein
MAWRMPGVARLEAPSKMLSEQSIYSPDEIHTISLKLVYSPKIARDIQSSLEVHGKVTVTCAIYGRMLRSAKESADEQTKV